MELSLYDKNNPIREWMENGRSNVEPLLDEEDMESDTPLPSRIVVEDDNPRDLQRITGTSSLATWMDQNVGDTHIGKWKVRTITRRERGKKQKKTNKAKPVIDSTTSDDNRQSPSYQESSDSSSASSHGDSGPEGGTFAVPPTTVQFIGRLHSRYPGSGL